MDKIELSTKRDGNTINNIAEKLELVSNTNMVTKEEFSFYNSLLLKM